MDPQAMQPQPLAIATDPRWLAAEKVINSRCFQRTARLRDFLLYVVRCELEGKTGEISEQNIGERVFARRENYSPLDDNIVRVSARQLRLKLKEYYDSDGSDDPWVIEIPKGGYVPAFHPRVLVPEAIVNELPPPAVPPTQHRALWMTLALALAGTLFAAWWGLADRHATVIAKAEPDLVRSVFRESAEPIQIVLSDSALAAMENMLGRSFTVEEYSNASYRTLPAAFAGNPHDVAVWNTLANQQVVNMGDVGAALHLRDSLAALNRQQQEPQVRSARDLRARGFRSGDYIILGGSTANPWAHLLEQEPFNFQFENIQGKPVRLVDRNPAPGEQHIYSADDQGHEYARVTLVPNLTKTGQALMIAGMSMESTEAAVNFCLSPDSTKLLSALHVDGKQTVPPFEALLRTTKEGGTGVKAEIVSVRLAPQI